MVEIPTLNQLMEAGAHFGHKKEKSYPKTRQFVYFLRDQIFVINLEKTREYLKAAISEVEKMAKDGKSVLFVGTKRQAKEAIESAAKKVEMPYVSHRWLGGMLTNFETVRRRIKYVEGLEEKLKGDEAASLTKKEKAKMEEELAKLHQTFDGIRSMTRLPDAIFVADVVKEKIAIAEAKKMGLPVIGIVDTNANPQFIDYPIPANDDSKKALDLIIGLVSQAIQEGKGKQEVKKVEPEQDKDKVAKEVKEA